MSKLMELVEEYGRDMARADSAPTSRAAEAYRQCASDTLSEIRAKVQELEREAARYRWLRSGSGFPSIAVCTDLDAMNSGSSGVVGTYEDQIELIDLDKAIDAAMEAANVPER